MIVGPVVGRAPKLSKPIGLAFQDLRGSPSPSAFPGILVGVPRVEHLSAAVSPPSVSLRPNMHPLAPGLIGRAFSQIYFDIEALLDGLQNIVQNLSPMGDFQDLGFHVQGKEIEGLVGAL
eukprot:7211337-Pyramimonas_sp.AAC.2